MKPQRSIVVVLLLVWIASCGASQRERSLRGMFVTVNAARDGFTTSDKEQQQKIIDTAKSLEEGKAALAAYRAEREKVVVVFDDVYRALVAAVVTEDTGSLTAAQKVVEKLRKALDDLKKVGPP